MDLILIVAIAVFLYLIIISIPLKRSITCYCSSCGTKLKINPAYLYMGLICKHCGKVIIERNVISI